MKIINMFNKNGCPPIDIPLLLYKRNRVGNPSANRNFEIIMQNRQIRAYSRNYMKRQVYRAVISKLMGSNRT